MSLLERIIEIFYDLLALISRRLKIKDEFEPPQIDSPHIKKPTGDKRVKDFREAFNIAIKYSRQGIEENKDKNLIRDWWDKAGKKGYTEKTPWCTLGVSIPLIEVGLIQASDLPRDSALSKAYIKDVPKGFKVVPVQDIEVGDIFIMWRGSATTGGGKNGWMGHIGWFDGYNEDKSIFYSIGANQNKKFNRNGYKSYKLQAGLRVIGGAVDTIDENDGIDLSIDTSFVPERFRQRALDMAQMFLLSKETRNQSDIQWAYNKTSKNSQIYKRIQSDTGVPWQAVAAIHYLESSVRFDRHIHNGDPLTSRTVRVPKNRPEKPPENGKEYTFEESVKDALTVLKRQPKNWTLPNLMYYLESYNGMGYYFRGLNSPYLVAGSQFQQSGKYVADGKFDDKAVSKRAGAIVLMKRLGYEPV